MKAVLSVVLAAILFSSNALAEERKKTEGCKLFKYSIILPDGKKSEILIYDCAEVKPQQLETELQV